MGIKVGPAPKESLVKRVRREVQRLIPEVKRLRETVQSLKDKGMPVIEDEVEMRVIQETETSPILVKLGFKEDRVHVYYTGAYQSAAGCDEVAAAT